MSTPPAILIVNGDEDTRIIFRTALESEGYRVLTAPDGDAAWISLTADRVALVVTELHVPSGEEPLVKRIKSALAGGAAPRVLVVTTQVFDEDRELARRLGCDGFLIKPLAVADLVREVARLLA